MLEVALASAVNSSLKIPLRCTVCASQFKGLSSMVAIHCIPGSVFYGVYSLDPQGLSSTVYIFYTPTVWFLLLVLIFIGSEKKISPLEYGP